MGRRDRAFTANDQKPFVLMAVTNKYYEQKKATFPEKSGLRDNWLPERNVPQNFFSYSFNFFLCLIKQNLTRTEYRFQGLLFKSINRRWPRDRRTYRRLTLVARGILL